jgi:P-type Ca2+ transporter type 2C
MKQPLSQPSTLRRIQDGAYTLTLNQMTARALFFHGRRFQVTGEGYGTAGAVSSDGEDPSLPSLRALPVPLVGCNDSRVEDG